MIQPFAEPRFARANAQKFPLSTAIQRRIVYRERTAPSLVSLDRQLHGPDAAIIRLVANAFPGAQKPGLAFVLRRSSGN